jgi:quercetin dioxygenase-like cupin family protein
MTTDFEVVDPDDVEQEEFPASGIAHRKLTEPLGCTEMRVNTVTLRPGQATAPHSHRRQEEVYIAIDGGHVRLEDRVRTVPPDGVVRIGPDVVRSVSNESDNETHTWIMFGAPPVGNVDDFGEYTLPKE